MRYFFVLFCLLSSLLISAQTNGNLLFPDQPDYAWIVDLLGKESSIEIEKQFFKKYPKKKEKFEFSTEVPGARYREIAGKKKNQKYSARIIINSQKEVVRVIIGHTSELFDGVHAVRVLGANSESSQDSLIAVHPDVYSSYRFENWYETDGGKLVFYFSSNTVSEGLYYEANFMSREPDPYAEHREPICAEFEKKTPIPTVENPHLLQKGYCISGCDPVESEAILYFGSFAYVGEVLDGKPNGNGNVYQLEGNSCTEHVSLVNNSTSFFTKKNLLYKGSFKHGFAEVIDIGDRKEELIYYEKETPYYAENMPFTSDDYGWGGYYTGEIDENLEPHDANGSMIIEKKLYFMEDEPVAKIQLDEVDFNHGFYRHDYMRRYQVNLLPNMRWHGNLTAYFEPKGEGTMFYFAEGDTVGYVGNFKNGFFQDQLPSRLTLALQSWDFDGVVENYSFLEYKAKSRLSFEGKTVYLYPRNQPNIRYKGEFNRLYLRKNVQTFPVGEHELQRKRGNNWVAQEKARFGYDGSLISGRDWYGISDELHKSREIYFTANISQPRMSESNAQTLAKEVEFILRRFAEYPELLYGSEKLLDVGFPGKEYEQLSRVQAKTSLFSLKGFLNPLGKYSDYHQLFYLKNNIETVEELQYLQSILVNELYALLGHEWFLEVEDENRDKGLLTYRFTQSSPEKFGYCRGECPEIVIQIFNGPRRDLMILFKYPAK